MTEEGMEFLGLKENPRVAVINPEAEGSGAGLAGSQDNGNISVELPEEDIDRMGAREFDEQLCEKTSSDWAEAQLADEAPRITAEL